VELSKRRDVSPLLSEGATRELVPCQATFGVPLIGTSGTRLHR
jgi:hypothetical protein